MTHSEMNDDGQRGRKWHRVCGGTTASKGAETNVVTYMFSMVCGSQSASGAALLYSDQHHVKLAVPPWRRREACQFAAAATTRGKQSHVTDADLRSRLGWGQTRELLSLLPLLMWFPGVRCRGSTSRVPFAMAREHCHLVSTARHN